jgi:hypothetical protein
VDGQVLREFFKTIGLIKNMNINQHPQNINLEKYVH